MYSGTNEQRRWILPAVLEEQARIRADQTFISMIDGESVTYAELNSQVEKVAGHFQRIGIGPGDRVAILLPNSIELVRVWMGAMRAGAVAVLINSELTHSFLAHPLRDCQASALVVHADLLQLCIDSGITEAHVGRIFLVGSVGESSFTSFEWQDDAAVSRAMPAAHEPACMMYTSGTTGPPKGVIMPHAHCFLFGLGVVENLDVTADDHYYIVLPLFHANGLLQQLGATLIAGARASVRARFSASAWMRDVRNSRATITHTLGAISAFILAQPPTPDDRNHGLRLLFAAPNLPAHEREWRARFGIEEVLSGYGMTEVNIPVYGVRGSARPGACGRTYGKYFELEIRDPDTDESLESGTVGEIVVRPRADNGFMAGYFNLPQKTADAWRNLWFHTGDAGVMDDDGYLTFIDRLGDCIRRRGENISATALEASFSNCEGVAEVAAYAVPAPIDGGEDEIMLAIVKQSEVALPPSAVAAHAKASMPRFMWPRYLVFRKSLPRTGTAKVRKRDLREIGVTADAEDLQAHYR